MIRHKSMKIIRLLIEDKKFKLAIILLIFLLILAFTLHYGISGDDVKGPLQTILVPLITTVTIFILSKIIDSIILLRQYDTIEGEYMNYNYRLDRYEDREKDDYYVLQDSKNGSKTTLTYAGNKSFVIEVNAGDYTWRGDFVMQSDNRAEVAWWYVSPKSMRHAVGYKKAVIRVEDKNVDIVLFGTDRSKFHRELLVKVI